MYQAQITSTIDNKPAGPNAAKTISHMLGGPGPVVTVDAEQGIYFIALDDYNETRLEQDGYLGLSVSGYIVEIDLP